MGKMSVLIQGWRGINHSYALVNQFQLLALLKRQELAVFHEDLPFRRSEWNRSSNHCGLSIENCALIDNIPPLNGPAEVVYRIAYPYRTYGSDSRRVFCFGTSEFRSINETQLYRGLENDRVYSNNDVDIVTPSHWSKQGFLNYGFRDEQVHVVPLGIDPGYFYPLTADEKAHARAEVGLPTDAFVYFNAGAMTSNKGIEHLLIAFAHICKIHPHAVLILKDQRNLYGITAEEALGELNRRLSAPLDTATVKRICIIGRNLSLGTMRLLYGVSDAYVSPYLAEGFNLTPLEAAACGTPIVVTEGGSTDDYAQPVFALKIASKVRQDGPRSLLEPNIDSLVACMESLIERKTPNIDMTKGAPWVAENFSWDNAAQKLSALFAR